MRILFFITIGLLINSVSANAAKPLFESSEPLQAVLTAPITSAYRERKKSIRLYQEGMLSYKTGEESNDRIPVKIRTRGNFRRLNCGHPPLQLNFSKKANDGTLFENQDKLKLVGPCERGAAFQSLVGLEYLIYKMWEQISPYHFKTRILELSYLDADKKRAPRQATTFVIEDLKDMSKRLKLDHYKVPKAARTQLDLPQTALLEVFQFMIGNTDYSTIAAPPGANCCHNARLLVNSGETSNAIPVPYDFDVSGFVDAPYAKPAEQYPIKNVRQRYFAGWCKESQHFEKAVQTFIDRKSQLYTTIQDTSVIGDFTKKKASRYLDRFFTLIEDPKRVQREIVGRCRGSVIPG